MPRSIVKVFGERNTGTRAVIRMLHDVPGIGQRVHPNTRAAPIGDTTLEKAIAAHFTGSWKRHYLHALRDDHAVANNGDDPWKHAAPRLTPGMVAADVRVLFLVRDPYSWAVSLARNPYHRKGPKTASFEAFLDRPWLTEQREGLASVLRSPMAVWSEKLSSYQRFTSEARAAGVPTSVLKFEDFVAAPTAGLAQALHELGIHRPAPPAPDRNTKRASVATADLQRFYAENLWETVLTAEAVARINALTDWQVAAAYGYRRRDPSDYPSARPHDVETALRFEMSGLGKRAETLMVAE